MFDLLGQQVASSLIKCPAAGELSNGKTYQPSAISQKPGRRSTRLPMQCRQHLQDTVGLIWLHFSRDPATRFPELPFFLRIDTFRIPSNNELVLLSNDG
jgi:hypothetical protein